MIGDRILVMVCGVVIGLTVAFGVGIFVALTAIPH